ncbi:MAG TPA: hypothetical protein VJU61_00825, partial [Polyangiaceae bacterium]|nr:hypothetical protein [Polyangiaceae bacterium]
MRLIFSCLFAASAIVGLPATTWAFFPTFAREVGGVGIGHPTITRNAIEQVLSQAYGITKTTKSIDDAIEAICKGNTLVDEDQVASSKHFDGENFLGGQERVAYERDFSITAAEKGQLSSARLALGAALHPLQDFYSHSNWVDLGNSSPLDLLTNPGRTQDELLASLDRWKALQGPRETRTCQGCGASLLATCAYDCSSNLITTGLTSGYYGGE